MNEFSCSDRTPMSTPTQDYPFAEELITDAEGHIRKVVLNVDDYWKLLESLEDEGLYRAMKEVQGEASLNLTEALLELERA